MLSPPCVALPCPALLSMHLQELIQMCQRMEALGAAPVLNDGLVGGNAGLLVVRNSGTLIGCIASNDF